MNPERIRDTNRKSLYAAVVIISVGFIISIYGASMPPTSSSASGSIVTLRTIIAVDPNDYATQNLLMTKGQPVNFTLNLDNETIFTFDVMNQSQYYIYYSCAPKCAQPLLGGNGSYYAQAHEISPFQLNVTVSRPMPFKGQFIAPANGTYYFVFDNSVGPTWVDYLKQNASGYTVGNFTLTTVAPGKSYSLDWIYLAPGIALMIFGGIIPIFSLYPLRRIS